MESMYNLTNPLDRSYAKALQLINSRTDLAWKHLKAGNHEKAADAIDMIGEVADDFLYQLEEAEAKALKALKATQGKKKKTAAPKKSATKKVAKKKKA
ncbi:MAG: hypothetical protein HC904_06795 [Blastochloris sp.]|nr:hypothetical protein [Blastochloris sp.]